MLSASPPEPFCQRGKVVLINAAVSVKIGIRIRRIRQPALLQQMPLQKRQVACVDHIVTGKIT